MSDIVMLASTIYAILLRVKSQNLSLCYQPECSQCTRIASTEVYEDFEDDNVKKGKAELNNHWTDFKLKYIRKMEKTL